MRPRGEVREALAAAIARLHAEQGAVTCRTLAQAANVGLDKARETIRAMTAAGEVVQVGVARTPGQPWCALYEPAAPTEGPDGAGTLQALEALAGVVQGWAGGAR